jgi:hypothetical protein
MVLILAFRVDALSEGEASPLFVSGAGGASPLDCLLPSLKIS